MHHDHRPAGVLPDRLGAGDAGFTLIEVLVTALIVVLLASATATALITTSNASADQRLRSQADALATQDQERLRGLSDEQLSALNGSPSRSETVDSGVFSVRSSSTYVDSQGTSSCTSTAAAYYKITSTVSWTENFSHAPTSVSEESLISRPVTGDLLTTVKDQTGAWLPGVSVTTIGGPSNQTGVTDANGCTVFAGLTPGSYSVGASEPGYVDPSGNAAPTSTTTVTATGAPATNAFTLGQAGSIAATFTTSGGAGAEADGLSWSGTGKSLGMGQPGTAPATSSGTQSAISSTPLFPFDQAPAGSTPSYADNYSVWAGRCPGQQPPSPGDQFSVTPGSLNQPASVQEPFLYFPSVIGDTTQPRPADIVLTYSANGCTDLWRPTIAASSNPNGWLANPGQPYAPDSTLTVCADYKYLGLYYVKGTVTTQNVSMTGRNTVPTVTITPASFGAC